MRLGADPDQLDRLARSFGEAAARVRESARRVAAAQDKVLGPGGAQRGAYRLLGETLSPLRGLADRLNERAEDLRRRARFQRVASTPYPGVVTVHESHAGDGRWLGRVGGRLWCSLHRTGWFGSWWFAGVDALGGAGEVAAEQVIHCR